MNLVLSMVANPKNKPKTRVLLIENGSHENETLKVMLESRNFDVFCMILNPHENPAKLSMEPDIIILDSSSQTIDCTNALQLIRPISPAPLLVLSHLDQPSIVARTLDCGADDFLAKPVSMDILIAYINKLTRRYHTNTLRDPSGG